jgi:hypothetical protein
MAKQQPNRQSGTTKGFKPQYKDERGEWKPIEINRMYHTHGAVVTGIPAPMMDGGILSHVWLYGEAQANALAWGFAADYEATHYRACEVRIVPWAVKYSIEYEPEVTEQP